MMMLIYANIGVEHCIQSATTSSWHYNVIYIFISIMAYDYVNFFRYLRLLVNHSVLGNDNQLRIFLSETKVSTVEKLTGYIYVRFDVLVHLCVCMHPCMRLCVHSCIGLCVCMYIRQCMCRPYVLEVLHSWRNYEIMALKCNTGKKLIFSIDAILTKNLSPIPEKFHI